MAEETITSGYIWNPIKCKEICESKEAHMIECAEIEVSKSRIAELNYTKEDSEISIYALMNFGIVINEQVLRKYCNNYRKMHGAPMRRKRYKNGKSKIRN